MGRVSVLEKPQDLALARPLLKWAGGKTQLLGEIIPKIPKNYGRFIEPFFGGGAVFFAALPEDGIIADSNPELVNLYRSVATDVDGVIAQLRGYQIPKKCFMPFGRLKLPLYLT